MSIELDCKLQCKGFAVMGVDMLHEEMDLTKLPSVRDLLVLPKPLAIAHFVSPTGCWWKTPHPKDLGLHFG